MTKRRDSGFFVALVSAAILTLSGCASTRSEHRQVDDAAITADVKARLVADPRVEAHEIDVDTVDGQVTLTGKVRDAATRDDAIHVARETEGVKRVKDNLTLGSQPTVGERIDDAGITARIKAKLIEDPLVKARDIDVDTVEGVVTLTGKVDSWAERGRAAEIAQDTSGVKGVKNRLEVLAGG